MGSSRSNCVYVLPREELPTYSTFNMSDIIHMYCHLKILIVVGFLISNLSFPIAMNHKSFKFLHFFQVSLHCIPRYIVAA